MLKNKKLAFRQTVIRVALMLVAAVLICAFAGISVMAQSAQSENMSTGLSSPDLSETVLIVLLVILIVCEVVGSVVIITLILRSLPKNKSKVIENPEVDEDE